ncbi:23S rRNA (guanosine(2251)-2'-O)-methyltransferase RlmB [Prochlorococcus sp. MIT 1307]|uniref:23S rRNA (guanosine(2251)-2'-O)-methyltransferase RlmB n=1 Tax=Prochlorococcus sp. MIT 1307 TaxID=3096219 RepID=UPI002A747A0B|nr:23S rRNA (guanosine(2251)-2'-O)-methyltransferase RlmB [Prochlorococcus sp. MIT 1307]
MDSRFDRSSNNLSRSGRSGGRRSQRKEAIPDKSLRREFSSEGRGPYRSKPEIKGEGQSRKDLSMNRNYRRNRSGQKSRYEKENDFEFSSSRTISSRGNNQRSFTRSSDQKRRRNASVSRKPRTQNIQPGNSFLNRNDFNSFDEKNLAEKPLTTDILWGRHVTQAALENGRPIHRIWCTPELRSSQRFLQLLRDAKSSGVLVEEVTWARLGQLTNGAVHQGIAIQTAAAQTLDLQTLIEGCNGLSEPPLLLALDGLTDPQNLGAIVRSAEAFGAHGLVLPQRRSAGLTGSVAKVAAGALEHLPVARVVNLNRSLEELKKAGYRIVGLAEEGNETLPEVDVEGPLVVVTGSEGKGISLVTRRHCDHLVRIPLRGVTPSLNASAATAVFLYEVARNGWMKGLKGQDPSPRMVRAKCASVSLESEESSFSANDQTEKKGGENNISNLLKVNSSLDDFQTGTCLNIEGDTDSGPFKQNIHL